MKFDNTFTYDMDGSGEWVIHPVGVYYGRTRFFKEENARVTAKLATEACDMLPEIDNAEHDKYILWITILSIKKGRGIKT